MPASGVRSSWAAAAAKRSRWRASFSARAVSNTTSSAQASASSEIGMKRPRNARRKPVGRGAGGGERDAVVDHDPPADVGEHDRGRGAGGRRLGAGDQRRPGLGVALLDPRAQAIARQHQALGELAVGRGHPPHRQERRRPVEGGGAPGQRRDRDRHRRRRVGRARRRVGPRARPGRRCGGRLLHRLVGGVRHRALHLLRLLLLHRRRDRRLLLELLLLPAPVDRELPDPRELPIREFTKISLDLAFWA